MEGRGVEERVEEDGATGALDPELVRLLEELRGYVDEELGELRADVSEHDRTLMDLLRGRPPWTRMSANGDQPEPDALLGRIDSAAAALERLVQADDANPDGEHRWKVWERMLRLAPATRLLIAELLCIPSGDERTALAFCLTLDDDRRGEVLAEISLAEQRELAEAERTSEETV